MKRRKILGTFMLMLPLMVVGCGKEGGSVAGDQQLESANESDSNEKSFIDTITGKEEYEGLKFKVPKSWEKISENKDIVLYKIDESGSNVSIRVDGMNSDNIDSYMKNVKQVLGKSIDLSKSSQESFKIGTRDARSLEYKYAVGNNSCNIYQVCFEESGKVYIFTLSTVGEKVENGKKELEKFISEVRF